jgi:hypothetical protein
MRCIVDQHNLPTEGSDRCSAGKRHKGVQERTCQQCLTLSSCLHAGELCHYQLVDLKGHDARVNTPLKTSEQLTTNKPAIACKMTRQPACHRLVKRRRFGNQHDTHHSCAITAFGKLRTVSMQVGMCLMSLKPSEMVSLSRVRSMR